MCLQSGWIAIFQLFRGVRHRWPVLVGLGLAFGGVVTITGFDMGSSPEALLGDLLAVAGGALAGIYTLAGGKARQSMGTGVYTTLCYGMCAAIVAGMALLAGQPLAGFEATGWLGILAITVCAQLVGHTAFNYLLATMSPLLVSMIILLEIPGAALLAAAFLDETLPAGTYAGLAMILVGLAVVVLGQRGSRSARRDGRGSRCRAAGGARHRLGRPGGRIWRAAWPRLGRYWPPRRAGWAALTVWMARSNFAGK